MRPTFQISVGGSDITQDVSARLVSLNVSDTVDETSDGLSLILSDSDQSLELPSSGARLDVSMGYDGVNERVGAYVVDEVNVEGPPDLVAISAQSTPFVSDRGGAGGSASLMARKNRFFELKTIQEIVETVAKDCGLIPAVDWELGMLLVDYVSQVNESDANMLLRLARQHGAILKPADGRLVFAAEQGGRSTSGASVSVSLTRSQITRWRFRQGGKTQGVAKVKASVHNYETADDEQVEAESSPGQFGTDAPSEGAEFADVFTFATTQDAKAATKTKAARIARAKRGAEIELPGTLEIIAGSTVNLSGIRSGIDGAWKAVTVRQTLSRAGWSTSVTLEGAE
jgi:uncharacterized protein